MLRCSENSKYRSSAGNSAYNYTLLWQPSEWPIYFNFVNAPALHVSPLLPPRLISPATDLGFGVRAEGEGGMRNKRVGDNFVMRFQIFWWPCRQPPIFSPDHPFIPVLVVDHLRKMVRNRSIRPRVNFDYWPGYFLFSFVFFAWLSQWQILYSVKVTSLDILTILHTTVGTGLAPPPCPGKAWRHFFI